MTQNVDVRKECCAFIKGMTLWKHMSKTMLVSAILAVLFTGFLGMANQNVKADGTGVCPCGNGKGFWTCANCNSFEQTPQTTTKQVGEWCKHYDWTDVTVCGHFNGFGYKQHQPQVTQTAYFRDCFWSYPVICHSL